MSAAFAMKNFSRGSFLFCRAFVKRAASSSSATTIFNKKLRILRLDRSSLNEEAHVYDYIRDIVAKDLCDRIDSLVLQHKQTIFNFGACSGLVGKNLNPSKVDLLIQGDISANSIRRARNSHREVLAQFPIEYTICDEEFLPIKLNSMDMVTSCLTLHWVNDLPKCFRQVYLTLQDNCPFIGCMFGGETLYELRSSLQLAEIERLSGFSPHIAPKTTGQDIAGLLQAYGFQLITVDIAEVKIFYPSMFELLFDLQGMGENNLTLNASHHLHRSVIESAASIYQCLYGVDEPDKRVPATFQVIHFIGWRNPTKATPLQNNEAIK